MGVMKIWFLVFAWGPVLTGYSLGWVIRHPDDWTGPAVLGPAGLVLTVLTFRWGMKRRAGTTPALAMLMTGGMVAGALMGLAILCMLVFNVIG